MKILVTGGAGFIGNNLILKLLELGHDVDTIDSVNDYYDVVLKEKRLARISDKVIVYREDICNAEALDKIFLTNSYDVICHLAAQAGVRYSLEHPEVYVQSNYVGTFNLLNCAKKYGVNQFLFASTSSVYGTSTNMPFKEDDSSGVPMSIYAATKRGCELLCANYNHLYDIQTTCLRFFTVYGPWGRPDMALYIFTEKILNGQPITVFNNGNMRRDFTYVDDIVSGFVKAIQKPLGYKILNLGNGKPVELMDFIGTLEGELGKKANINFEPLQPGDVPETYADISQAQELIGYSPQFTVQEGIKNFVNWYQEQGQF